LTSWQLKPKNRWRLDPNQIYGRETDDPDLLEYLQSWAEGRTPDLSIRPWASPNDEQELKDSKDPSVVANPPLYDEYVDLS
jgi:hypothetical protein